jgi:hypothetical protein
VKDFAVQENTLYILRINDPGVSVRLKWNKDLYKLSHESVEGTEFHLGNAVHYYFYVPKCTTEIGVYFGKNGCTITPPDGAVTQPYTYNGLAPGAVSIPILDQADTGQIWKVFILGSNNGVQGTYLLNVPSQLARSPKELLIQRSLIDKDGL